VAEIKKPRKRTRKSYPRNRHLLTAKKDAFLSALRQGLTATGAAELAKVSRECVYAHRACSQPFRRAWDKALEAGTDRLEEEARRRAAVGLLRKKFHNGDPIIDPDTGKQYSEREYSDTLLIFLLKGRRPEKFRDNLNVTGKLAQDIVTRQKTPEEVCRDIEKAAADEAAEREKEKA
jgi:hypothetical protein